MTDKTEKTEIKTTAVPAEPAKVDDQDISVRALRTFHKAAGLVGDVVTAGDEFVVGRLRAAELRANGLIEYVKEADEKAIHGEADAKKIAERIKQDIESRLIPDQHKTGPLRNPELKLADVPAAKK